MIDKWNCTVGTTELILPREQAKNCLLCDSDKRSPPFRAGVHPFPGPRRSLIRMITFLESHSIVVLSPQAKALEPFSFLSLFPTEEAGMVEKAVTLESEDPSWSFSSVTYK